METILVFGGLGDPKSSVIALYQPLLRKLQRRFHLVAIDPAVSHPDALLRRQQYAFEYADAYASLQAYRQQHSTESVAASFLLTPVATHLPLIEDLYQHGLSSNSLIVVEKPSFSLHQCERGFHQLILAMRARGTRFYFVDTALVAPSLEAYLKRDDALSTKRPNKIIAVASDNPVNSVPALDAFRLKHNIAAINQRRLLEPEMAGGAGLGLDMGVHAIAGLVRLLQYSAWEVSGFDVTGAQLEALMHVDLLRQPGAETYLYAQGTLQAKEHQMVFEVQGGKGSDIWDRRLELYFDDQVVVIGLGTLKHAPYLWRWADGREEFQLFAAQTAGYSQHAIDILAELADVPDSTRILTCLESELLMEKTMAFLNQIYLRVGDSLHERERQIRHVDKHSPAHLSEREYEVRSRLYDFVNRIIQRE